MTHHADYLPGPYPERGQTKAPCLVCGREPGNQHSLRQSGACDRKRWLAEHPEGEEAKLCVSQ